MRRQLATKAILLKLISPFLLLLTLSSHSKAQDQFEILVLAVPDKYHYEYIPIARDSFQQLAKHHQFTLTWTHEFAAYENNLSKFAAVVFLNTPGDGFNEAQRKKFQEYIRAGGNSVVIHRGVTGTKAWPWYEEMVGRSFKVHPMIQTAVVNVVDPTFPATFGLPAKWIWSDEWYEFENPHNTQIHKILNVDEKTYDPTKIWVGQVSTGMGKDHPVSWYREFEGGRVFVTALGHNAELYKDQVFLEHIYGGIYWAATAKGIQKN